MTDAEVRALVRAMYREDAYANPDLSVQNRRAGVEVMARAILLDAVVTDPSRPSDPR